MNGPDETKPQPTGGEKIIKGDPPPKPQPTGGEDKQANDRTKS